MDVQSNEKLLTLIGIPNNLSGFRYIDSALKIIIDDNGMEYGITKVIYPTIAQKYNVSPLSVERSIRYAIIAAFDRGNKEIISDIFSPLVGDCCKIPSNSDFIFHLADTIIYNRSNN